MRLLLLYIVSSIQQVHQSAFFSEARTRAKVSFLDHQILECDCNGKVYVNENHDITLRIPKGAVAEGKRVHLEIAVALYGPFEFSKTTRPISPILWLCLLEEDELLTKSYQVILPHYIKDNACGYNIGFVKASHNNYAFSSSGKMSYKFQECEGQVELISMGDQNYGVLETSHFCYLCMEAENIPNITMDMNYCLTRVESYISPPRQEIYFCASYFLPTCLQVNTPLMQLFLCMHMHSCIIVSIIL